MATYDKRGNSWRAQIRRKGASPFTQTFKSKADAVKWAIATEALIAQGKLKPSSTKTVEDAFNEYAERVSPMKSGRWEANRIKAFIRDYPEIASKKLDEVNSRDFGLWRDARLAGNEALKIKPVSSSTVVRDLNLFSHIFTTARDEWKWIAESPLKGMRRPTEAEPRSRKITDDEIERILTFLGYSPDETPVTTSQQIGATFVLALETAMRRGEIISLTWANVHIDKLYVHLPKTKNGSARSVPLSPRAVSLLNQVRPARAKPTDLVFNINAATADTLFRNARIKTGLNGFTFHDARRTALTRLAKIFGVLDLAKISGHKDLKILSEVYYSPEATDLAQKLHAA